MGLVDFDTLLYDPAYTVFGEAAVLTLKDGFPQDLLVIDKTAGSAATFGGGHSRGNLDFSDVGVMTVIPAAMVRASDLAGIDLADLHLATITFNGKTWTVMDHQLAPATTGEGGGEIRLILEAA